MPGAEPKQKRYIVIDAAGGDGNISQRVVNAAVKVASQLERRDEHLLLVGPPRIEHLVERSGYTGSRIELLQSGDGFPMDATPAMRPSDIAPYRYSIMVACDWAAKSSDTVAVLSAGNTAASVYAAQVHLDKMPHFCIAMRMPTRLGRKSTIFGDGGAMKEPSPGVVARQAMMMAEWYRCMYEPREPVKVGLLSIGAEPAKANKFMREAHDELQQYLQLAAYVDYQGFVEGNNITDGSLDVVATDGFTGNQMLKGMEGAVLSVFQCLQTLEYKSAARAAAELFSPEAKGAELLLGTRIKPIYIAHGASSEYALESGILFALKTYDMHAGYIQNLENIFAQ